MLPNIGFAYVAPSPGRCICFYSRLLVCILLPSNIARCTAFHASAPPPNAKIARFSSHGIGLWRTQIRCKTHVANIRSSEKKLRCKKKKTATNKCSFLSYTAAAFGSIISLFCVMFVCMLYVPLPFPRISYDFCICLAALYG